MIRIILLAVVFAVSAAGMSEATDSIVNCYVSNYNDCKIYIALGLGICVAEFLGL
jgi:hypothetical protein